MIMTELYDSRVETNGIRLHVVHAGRPEDPLVILLHGFPEFWYGWRSQIEPLAQSGYRVLALDQRGYNLSDKPSGLSAYRMDVLAKDVVGVIDAVGRQKAVLVGHDWGGVIAWVTAILYPERVEKLAVLNAAYPAVALRTLPGHPEQLLRSAYMYFFQLPFLPEAMLRKNNWEALADGMRRTSLPDTFNEADFNRYREAWWKKDAMTSMLNWYRALFRPPLRIPLSPRLRMPVLILWGKQDFALGRELAKASVEFCEHGELVFFKHATHWLQHEEPEDVNRRLLQFFHNDSPGNRPPFSAATFSAEKGSSKRSAVS
jgi:pimeloyl-ACP methyl ester carboxylesterase